MTRNKYKYPLYPGYYFNMANQGREVKILHGNCRGRVGIYTGISSWRKETIYVRVDTHYYIYDVEELQMLPKGKMAGILYED